MDWGQVEERIRPHVKALHEAGYKTTASCGHDMWIMLDVEPSRLPQLHDDLKRLDYKSFEIKLVASDDGARYVRVSLKGQHEGDGRPFDLVLLKIEPDALPVYFVVRHRRFPEHGVKGSEEQADHDEYFFNEHTCPTNWTDDIVAVISEGDEDPHGFARFVRSIKPPDDMDWNGDGHDGTWVDLFPETAPPSSS